MAGQRLQRGSHELLRLCGAGGDRVRRRLSAAIAAADALDEKGYSAEDEASVGVAGGVAGEDEGSVAIRLRGPQRGVEAANDAKDDR